MRRITLSIRMTQDRIEKIHFRKEAEDQYGTKFETIPLEVAENPYARKVDIAGETNQADLFREVVGAENPPY